MNKYLFGTVCVCVVNYDKKNSPSRRWSTLLPLTDMSTGSSLLSTLICFLCFIDWTQGQCSFVILTDTYMADTQMVTQNVYTDAECASRCLADSNCWAYIFGAVCRFADLITAAGRFYSDGDTMNLKECVETTTESTTTTTLPSTTTTTPSTTTTTTSTTTSQPTTTSLTTTTATTTTPVAISSESTSSTEQTTTSSTLTTTPITTTETTTTTSTTSPTATTPSPTTTTTPSTTATTTPTTTIPTTPTPTTTLPTTSSAATTSANVVTTLPAGTILSNTDAGGQIVSLTTSSCKTACDLVLQCQHYVLDTNNVCKLFTSTPEQTTQTGSILGRKINCPDGQPCCYQTISDTNDETVPQLSFTQTFSSCQELCLKLAQCRAVVFTGTTCKVYKYVDQTSSQPGYTMYIKPDGVSSDYSVSDVCLKGSSTKPLIHLIIVALASMFLLTRSILH